MKGVLIAVALMLAGCAYEPDFHPYVGTEAEQPAGTGGTIQVIDGMTVWDDCAPPRRYVILGTLGSEGGKWSSANFELGIVVKGAKKIGADAVIVTDEQNGIGAYAVATAIRYLPGGNGGTPGLFDDLIPGTAAYGAAQARGR
ncbi:MAG: hypothetical protein ABSE62_16405 [Chthoniobacteraceae bacterium]|jgi:hypothetical protein